jgi:hypothetical protein
MNAELYKPVKLCFKVFKTLGLWQDGNQSWTYFFVGYSFHFVTAYLHFCGELMYIFNEAQNLVQFVDALVLSTLYLSVIGKSANLFFNIKSIKKILEDVNHLLEITADDRWKSREKLHSEVSFGFKVYKAFWMSAVLNCVMAIFVPIFSHELPYKVWFPFDTKESLTGFWFASVLLIANSFVISAVVMALDVLPVIFMTFVVGLIEELTDRLEMVGRSESTRKQEKEFVKCIEIHLKIKELAKDIQTNFSSAILFQGILSAIILCTSAFTTSMVHDVATFIQIFTFMVPMVFEIFLPCYLGSLLSVASSKLSMGFFHSKWFESNGKDTTSMLILMENLKRDIKISSFGLFFVNLASFTSICNFAYSLFAVLKKVNAK